MKRVRDKESSDEPHTSSAVESQNDLNNITQHPLIDGFPDAFSRIANLPPALNIAPNIYANAQPFPSIIQVTRGEDHEDALLHNSGQIKRHRLNSPEESGLNIPNIYISEEANMAWTNDDIQEIPNTASSTSAQLNIVREDTSQAMDLISSKLNVTEESVNLLSDKDQENQTNPNNTASTYIDIFCENLQKTENEDQKYAFLSTWGLRKRHREENPKGNSPETHVENQDSALGSSSRLRNKRLKMDISDKFNEPLRLEIPEEDNLAWEFNQDRNPISTENAVPSVSTPPGNDLFEQFHGITEILQSTNGESRLSIPSTSGIRKRHRQDTPEISFPPSKVHIPEGVNMNLDPSTREVKNTGVIAPFASNHELSLQTRTPESESKSMNIFVPEGSSMAWDLDQYEEIQNTLNLSPFSGGIPSNFQFPSAHGQPENFQSHEEGQDLLPQNYSGPGKKVLGCDPLNEFMKSLSAYYGSEDSNGSWYCDRRDEIPNTPIFISFANFREFPENSTHNCSTLTDNAEKDLPSTSGQFDSPRMDSAPETRPGKTEDREDQLVDDGEMKSQQMDSDMEDLARDNQESNYGSDANFQDGSPPWRSPKRPPGSKRQSE